MKPNTLYFGDNLAVLREKFADESVDLIYLDPPFNSNRNYNYLYREVSGAWDAAQEQAFVDTWTMEGAAAEYQEVTESGRPEGRLIAALREVYGNSSLVAYLSVMALRLRELHRVLKPGGSLYLHCDPTAGHYLKMMLDSIFGMKGFAAEIVWSYRRWPTKTPNYQHMHDLIYFYRKPGTPTWNQLFEPHSESFQRRFKGKGNIQRPGATKKEASDKPTPGLALRDVWEIPIIAGSSKERLGYPTQKPLELLKRIVEVSSNPGDVVLDPFCGCGTAVAAAEALGRRWAGIDISSLAVTLVRERLSDHFPEVYPEAADVAVDGLPTTVAAAEMLAQNDPYDFQCWALTLVGATPPGGVKKKGADRGIDGLILWHDAEEHLQKAIVSVKGGRQVSDTMVKDLIATVEAEDAAAGLFVTLAPPTRPMRERALTAGQYRLAGTTATFPRIQIWTIADLLDGRRPELPRTSIIEAHRAAKRQAQDGQQGRLFGD